jgi:uncharacterized iron-regulated membrane protein
MKKGKFTYRILFQLHRFFGLTAGFYFVLLGLSGSYIVYQDTFQRWLSPGIRTSVGSTPTVALAPLVAAAQKGLATNVDPMRIEFPESPTSNAKVMFNLPTPEEKRRMINAFVDPVTLEFRGSENFKETPSGKIFVFHHDLFLGPLGRTIMGVFGLMMLAILFTGFYLVWPKRGMSGKGWLQVFKLRPIRNALMFNRETHRILGAYSLILMILVTFSGAYISKPTWFQFGAGPASRDKSGMPRSDEEVAPIDYSKVDAEFQTLTRPMKIRIDAKKQSITLDGASPEKSQPKTFAQNQRAIHGGHFWGDLGLFLIFLSGLLPLYFYISGFIIWRKRHAHANAH